MPILPSLFNKMGNINFNLFVIIKDVKKRMIKLMNVVAK